MSLLEAVRTGNRRDTLVAMRDLIAARLDNCESGRDSAALSKRLMEILDELDQIEVNNTDDGWEDVLNGVAM